MKSHLFLSVLLTFHVSFAELSDAEVSCVNMKGETIHDRFFRIEKDSVKVFETPGGFAFFGQVLFKRNGRFSQEPCGLDLGSVTETVLVTCAPGSQIRFLNKVLPTIQVGCR